jgi:chromosome segregation ATPase
MRVKLELEAALLEKNVETDSISNAASQVLALREELKSNQNDFEEIRMLLESGLENYQKYLHDGPNLATMTSNPSDLKQQIVQLSEILRASMETSAEKDEEVVNCVKGYQAISEEFGTLQARFVQISDETERFKQELLSKDEDLFIVQTSYEQALAEVRETKEKLLRLQESTIKEAELSNEAMEEVIKIAENETKLVQENEELKVKLEKLEGETVSLRVKLGKTEGENVKLQAKVEKVEEGFVQLNSKLEKKEELLKKYSTALKQHKAQIAELTTSLEEKSVSSVLAQASAPPPPPPLDTPVSPIKKLQQQCIEKIQSTVKDYEAKEKVLSIRSSSLPLAPKKMKSQLCIKPWIVRKLKSTSCSRAWANIKSPLNKWHQRLEIRSTPKRPR